MSSVTCLVLPICRTLRNLSEVLCNSAEFCGVSLRKFRPPLITTPFYLIAHVHYSAPFNAISSECPQSLLLLCSPYIYYLSHSSPRHLAKSLPVHRDVSVHSSFHNNHLHIIKILYKGDHLHCLLVIQYPSTYAPPIKWLLLNCPTTCPLLEPFFQFIAMNEQ